MRYLLRRHHLTPGVFYSLPPAEQMVLEAMVLLEIDEDGLVAELTAQKCMRGDVSDA